MKLNKEKWENTHLHDCCFFQRGVVYSNKDEVDHNGICILRANNISLSSSKIDLNDIRLINSEFKIQEKQRLIKNDIFICTASGSLEHVGKIAFIDENTNCYAGGFMGIIRTNQNVAISKYLFYSLLSKKFTTLIKSQRSGTNIQNLKFSDISNFQIPLPPLEEQKQIVLLFQSIDDSIEKVEMLEKKLLELQKKLCSGLVNVNPYFGDLLNMGNCNKTIFGKIADCIEKHDKLKVDVKRFVGLEDLTPESFEIATWGNIEKGTTFTKCFQKGDVLFGKRRAYLKKVAIADFEGVCSGDILVFRANQGLILQGLLPYYVASEAFMKYAVQTSAGSLSPRTKWKDLKDFQISIPCIRVQRKILTILDQLNDTNQKLKLQKQALKFLKDKLLDDIFN